MNKYTLRKLLLISLVGLCSVIPAFSQGLAERERIRRENLIVEAEQHLFDGRAAYAKGDFETAVQQYRAALDKTPQGSAAASRRKAISEHLGDGSVALSQKYRQIGKYDEAREMLEAVLLVDPTNQAAIRQLEYLDDPIRTNPALTYEHTQNVDRVRRLLYLGEGYYNLGQFDKAEVEFNSVLRIDAYNKAARRWLEKCAAIKSDYYRAAYDETRAQLLLEVDKAWELTVAPELEDVAEFQQTNGFEAESRGSYITNKLRSIIIPTVDFEDTTVDEAVDFLRMRSRELDTTTIDPSRKGVNFIVRGSQGGDSDVNASLLSEDDLGAASGDPTTARIPQLKLQNVPLVQVLQFICDLAKLRYRVDEYAVTLLPLDSADTSELITRTWNVTPTFIADLGGSAGGTSAVSDDPFGDSAGSESSLGAPQSVQELLLTSGVDFADGATANFLAATSTLIVKNTINNLDLVDTIVERVNRQTPKQIKISTKFVEVTQENNDEIGFDWNLTVPGTGFGIRGGSVGNGTEITDGVFGGRPITSGIRSGDYAASTDNISSLISNSNTSVGDILSAPGILSLGGILSGNTVEMIFRGLSQKRGVDLMTAPSVVARSGDTAKIEVIREFIYPTEYEPPEIPNNVRATGVFPVTPATPTAFETRNTGVILEIQPTTGETNDYVINLDFAPEIVEFEGFLNYGSAITGISTDGDPIIITDNRIEMPVFSTRRVSTALTIYDGHTVAVGGLMREDVQNVEDKVPILGDIPLIGRLFQSKAENRTKSNLIIFVTAQVIDATGRPIRGANLESANPVDSLLGDNLLPPPIN